MVAMVCISLVCSYSVVMKCIVN